MQVVKVCSIENYSEGDIKKKNMNCNIWCISQAFKLNIKERKYINTLNLFSVG